MPVKCTAIVVHLGRKMARVPLILRRVLAFRTDKNYVTFAIFSRNLKNNAFRRPGKHVASIVGQRGGSQVCQWLVLLPPGFAPAQTAHPDHNTRGLPTTVGRAQPSASGISRKICAKSAAQRSKGPIKEESNRPAQSATMMRTAVSCDNGGL